MFLLLFKSIQASILITSQNQCIENIILHLFPNNETVVLINTNIFFKNKQVIVLKTPIFNVSGATDTYGKNFIIKATNENKVFEIINILILTKIWHTCKSAAGNFLIICKNCKGNIFLKLWNMDIIYVILSNTTHFISSSPYKDENNCGKDYKWFVEEKCDAVNNTAFFSIPKTLKNCKMKALPITSAFTYPGLYVKNNKTCGVYIDQLKLFADVYKFDFDTIEGVKNSEFTKKLYANSAIQYQWYGNKTVDTIVGWTVNIMKLCVTSRIYYEDVYYWVAPKAQKIPNVKLLYIIFDTQTWILFLITHTVAIIVTYAISHFDCKKSINDAKLNKIFVLLLKIMLQQDVLNLPSIWKLKLFLWLFVFYNLLVSIYFKTKLSSILTEPVYEKSYKSIYDMLHDNLKFFILTPLVPILKQRLPEFTNGSYTLRPLFRKEDDYIQDIVLHRNFTTHVMGAVLKIRPRLRNNVAVVKADDLDKVFWTFPFRYTYPFRKILNKFIGRIQEAGIHIKILHQYALVDWEDHVEKNIALTTEHISSGFFVLFLGLFSGFLIFVLETFYSYCHAPNV